MIRIHPQRVKGRDEAATGLLTFETSRTLSAVCHEYVTFTGRSFMSQLFDSIRSPYRSLDPTSALEKPTSILLGVSQSAATALGDVRISTVFDLASSAVFANAVDICL